MYRAFNLKQCQWPKVLVKEGEKLFERTLGKVSEGISEFFNDGKIDGSRLRDHWFPGVEADVFISHSSRDRNDALALAAWLQKRFKLKSFIDSTVWGHSSVLLKELDDDHCYDPKRKVYDYHARNITTSHVHMMLATALSRMIDVAECVIFVSSPNSVSHSDSNGEKLTSPWIFYELAQMAIVRKEKRDREHLLKEAREVNFAKKASVEIPIEYDADFEALTQINVNTLTRWKDEWTDSTTRWPSPLDALYEIAPHESE